MRALPPLPRRLPAAPAVTRVAVVLLAAVLAATGMYLAGRSDPDAPEAGAQPGAAASQRGPDGFRPVPPLAEAPPAGFDGPESVLRDDRRYHARLVTSEGVVRIRLYARRAPRTVNNFVFLARHGFYDGAPFHRVLDGFMAQTGDPGGTGSGGPGYAIEDEFHPELRHDRPGVVSMANAGPDTGGSQFFITFAPTPWLDDRHAVFGVVEEGMEVVERLQRIDPSSPDAVVQLSAPAARLAEHGVAPPPEAETVEDALVAELGALPLRGQSFTIGDRRGVLGQAGGGDALALYPVPDVLEEVTILAAPREG